MRTICISPSIKGEKLSAENLRMVNGVSGGLEALAWIISDPGDLVIVPTPTYARWMIRSFNAYMQKTCDVAEKAILAEKKLRKKCVNRDKM